MATARRTAGSGFPDGRLRPDRGVAKCSGCALQRICLPRNVDRATLGQFENLIQNAVSVRQGAPLYRQGDAMKFLFVVRTGGFKTVLSAPDGNARILGIHRPGDTLGLEALGERHHTFDAIALESSAACLIPHDRFAALCRSSDAMQTRFLKIMGEAIQRHAALRLALSQPVETRVILFLIEASRHAARRGFAPGKFDVRLTRQDMGNYLNIATETTSRILSALAQDRLIEIRGWHLYVPSIERLQRQVATQDAPRYYAARRATKP